MSTGGFRSDVEKWAALRTSGRWEKKLAAGLEAAGVPVFLPLIAHTVRYASKTQTSHVPAFGGYVFCGEAEFVGNPRVTAACRKQVSQILRPSDYATLRAELTKIASFLTDHRLVQESLYGTPGGAVRIVGGPLRGQEGIIVGLKPGKRVLVLEVSFLGARLDAEVDEADVEKI